MELSAIDQCGPSGFTLNVEEKAGLESAMLKRQLEEGLDKMYFWGKIYGVESDYLVVFSIVPSDDFPTKKFYFCSSKSYMLQAFPARLLTKAELELARRLALSHRMTGDPTKVLSGEGGDEEDEAKEGVSEDLAYREIHHLAYMVWLVDSNTSVIPSGAFVFDAAGRLVPNPTFSGLDRTMAPTLSSYLHLRKPQGRSKLWQTRQGMVDVAAILDPVGGQRAPPHGPCPVGAWSLLVDGSGTKVTIRSNEFPGYHFFSQVGSNFFGGVYFGNLQPNVDLGFMV